MFIVFEDRKEECPFFSRNYKKKIKRNERNDGERLSTSFLFLTLLSFVQLRFLHPHLPLRQCDFPRVSEILFIRFPVCILTFYPDMPSSREDEPSLKVISRRLYIRVFFPSGDRRWIEVKGILLRRAPSRNYIRPPYIRDEQGAVSRIFHSILSGGSCEAPDVWDGPK